MVGYITYMHIFALFPCLFYIFVVNNSKKIFTNNVRLITNVLSIIVLLTHILFAKGWLGPSSTFFPPLSTNVVSLFSTLPLNNKIIVFCCALLSTIFYYNLF
jgi:hypothetical protein